ncbi:MAG: prephenate dehydrogenase dimerization domain-containing protein, partial [Sciscionella sp.]
ALDCGAHVVPADPAGHDDAVARISHLPHVLAAILASVGADGGPLALALAAGSFTDGTRVAGTDPDLARAMCEGNRAALLPALDDALGRLGAARGSLASTGALGATLNAGNRARAALDHTRASRMVPVRLDLTAPDAATALLAIGERGGRVVDTDGDTVVVEVPETD